jgi:hypothetical protein
MRKIDLMWFLGRFSCVFILTICPGFIFDLIILYLITRYAMLSGIAISASITYLPKDTPY